MYCPSCGTEVTKELNYCNRCGANLNLTSNIPEPPLRPVNLTGPTIAVAAMVIVGMIVIFATVSEMARGGFHPVALTWMALGGLAMIACVASLIIRQWSHLAGITKTKEQRPVAPRQKSVKNEAAPAQLPPMRNEPMGSVTENTTRTFEPMYRNPPERGR